MNFDYLGIFIRSFRQANGESLQSLADRSGVSRSMIAQIESGQKNPTISVLDKLARAMAIKLEDLVKQPDGLHNEQVIQPNSHNIVSKKDSPFTCHLLAARSASSPADFYRFRFTASGKTSFAANPSPKTMKYLWVEKGSLIVHLASETVQINAEQTLLFNATIPHRFENPKGDLAYGTFTVVYQT